MLDLHQKRIGTEQAGLMMLDTLPLGLWPPLECRVLRPLECLGVSPLEPRCLDMRYILFRLLFLIHISQLYGG